MKIADIKIGHRLTFAFSLTVLVLALVVSVGTTKLNLISSEINLTVNDRYQKINELSNVKDAIDQQARSLRNILLMSDPDDINAEIVSIESTTKKISAEFDRLAADLKMPEAQKQFKAIIDARAQFSPGRDQLVSLVKAGNKEYAIILLFQEVRPAQQKLLAELDKLIAFQVELMRISGLQATETASSAGMLMIALGLIGALISFIAAWLTTRRIVGPINSAVIAARTVASGDLTGDIKVTSKDEIGQLSQALKDMNDSLVQIVGDVRVGTETIATASAEIAAGNLDLSSRTEHQASSLEETASSMEELTSTVRQNADNARQANQLALSAAEVASKGGAVVAQVVDTMTSINDSSKKIVDIIGVIDGIAFQTNILALNAAVEAARAGEQGRGFAVVATEVRNLAQRSAGAAKEIKELIGDSVMKVDAGAKLVDQAGVTMTEIVASVRRVTDIMGEISSASNEQMSGIEQINEAISQMDQVTQQNAALVEQASAAAATMQEQTEHLSNVVDIFKISNGQGNVYGNMHAGNQGQNVQASVTRSVAVRPKPAKPAKPDAQPRIAAAPAKSAPPKASSGADDWEEF
jgi:methyl-accepting chemotaxis protein